MYGVFQSRSQGPLSSSLARVLMENWIFSEVLELHAPQSFKIVTNKVCWSLTEMSVGDKRTAEAMRGPVVEFLLRDHNDSEIRWENEHEVSGQHQRKEHDKLDLNSRMWWRVTWDTECMEISRTGSSTREYQLIFACSIDEDWSQSRLRRTRCPALEAVCLFLLWILLALKGISPIFWLALVITLVLVLHHSIQKHPLLKGYFFLSV